ncbi:hypothetical protein ZIOFF_038409 [Zingiber officinale]|uniref:Uncharacterized protein n=1 Tax=Zingiber officinale TaxID=94328 RepID=A0A8J5KZG9_ZINOF|nr:hypothetical protein ZIOFF_038409 [Zingiber officinale]
MNGGFVSLLENTADLVRAATCDVRKKCVVVRRTEELSHSIVVCGAFSRVASGAHLQSLYTTLKFWVHLMICDLLGVSFGANIVDFVARKAFEAGKLIESVKVVAQVLMYPFFARTVPIHSELKLTG